MPLSERVQVSLPFETEDELDLYQKVVRPLRQNRQLRQTILDLLSLVRDKPLEVEALLNGENLVAQDQYAKDFMNDARLLEQNLVNVNSKLNQTYHSLATTPVDTLLSGIAPQPQPQPQPTPSLTSPQPQPSQSTSPDTGVLNLDEIKQQITQSVLDTVLPNIKDVLDDFKSGTTPHQQPTPPQPTPISEPTSSFVDPKASFTPNTKPSSPTLQPSKTPLEPAPTSSFQIRDFDDDEEDLLNLGDTGNSGTQTQTPNEPDNSSQELDQDLITKMMLEAAKNSLG